jgi:outer membrane protein OmpA-like peptidoglycan-associated protein
MAFRLLVGLLLVIATASSGLANAVIPAADVKGSKDSPLLGRYKGSFIVSFDQKDYNEFTFPLSVLERVEGKRDNHNNHFFAPKQKKDLEGAFLRLVYLLPENVSPLEGVRNYRQEIKEKGGEILYECKAEECGGDPARGSTGGGGETSLAMFLRPEEQIKDQHFSNGACAQTSHISDQRYTVGMLAESGAHVSVLAYTLKKETYCDAFAGRTAAIVDIVVPKQREQKMVTVKADEMAKKISATGSIALYGIYFDFNKADLRPESQPTLEQIARLLKEDPKLKLLVVGHTDNAGALALNMDLSQQRAAAVVHALVTGQGVDKSRLTPVGVAFASPVASNKTEEGRAKNRRVELVEN